MFLELLEPSFWPPALDPPPNLPDVPTELHPTEEERAEMRARARVRHTDCNKSLDDARSVADILASPIPKDANDRIVTDVCLFGLLKRSPDDALELLAKLPKERWCPRCRASSSTLLLSIGPRAAPLLVPLLQNPYDFFVLFKSASTGHLFSQIAMNAFAGSRADFQSAARRHLRRFPTPTAKLALAIAAGAPFPGLPEARARAGILLSILARLGRERAVRDAARELGLEALAERWMAIPPMGLKANAKGGGPSAVVLERKKLSKEQRTVFFTLLARIDWALAGRDIPKLREALDQKSRKGIAVLLLKRWKRRTSETWPAIVALALEPKLAAEIGNIKTIVRSSRSYFQRNVERSAVEALAGAAIAIPEARDVMLARLGSIALDPVKKRIHMAKEAERAIVDVADALGLPAETLDDRSIPTLGLDANASMMLDWGGRPVEVRMTPALELVFVVDGEKRSAQPSPRKTDKKQGVAKAKKIVEGLRTEARVLALGLGPRVTRWMRDRQRWQKDDFQKNVLGHPILRAIARGFVWGMFDAAPFGGSLVSTFRVAEDGSLADENDNTTEPSGSRVGLLHIAELSPELRQRWGTVMADYELLPIVPQLAELRVLTPEQAKAQVIETTWARYPYNAPLGWTTARYGVFERVIGRHRIVCECDYSRKSISGRVRNVESYEENWLEWGSVPAIVSHETLVDMQEMSG